jgi:hypothetical protein
VQDFDTNSSYFHGLEELIEAHSTMLYRIRDRCFLHEREKILQDAFQLIFEYCLRISTIVTDALRKDTEKLTDDTTDCLQRYFHQFEEQRTLIVDVLESAIQNGSRFYCKREENMHIYILYTLL